MKIVFQIVISAVLTFVPLVSGAEVLITEIMYDLEGADAGREWVEIYNNGSENVDLSLWRLYEDETNHKLTVLQGGFALSPGAYAVIADDADQFKSEWPQFQGTLLDSSFSLSNTGELIALHNEELNEVDSITYSAEWGAGGDGKSLQKASGEWKTFSPTVGSGTLASGANENTATSDSGSAPPLASSEWQQVSTEPSSTVPYETIKALIKKRDTHVPMSAPTKFEGYATGFKDEPLLNARYVWSLGDGTTKEGQNILHLYKHQGKYVVVLNVSSGEESAQARLDINVTHADISIKEIGAEEDFYIVLYNASPYEVDLGDWLLHSKESYFRIPRNTFILKTSNLTLAQGTTGLPPENTPELLFPDGTVAFSYIGIDKEASVLEKAEDPPPTPLLSQQGTGVIESEQETVKEDAPLSLEKEGVGVESVREEAALIRAQIPTQEEKNISLVWFSSAFFLVILALAGFFVMRKSEISPLGDEELLAEEVTIEEIKTSKDDLS